MANKKTFEKVYKLTDTRGGEAAYSKKEARAYHHYLRKLNKKDMVVEIGLEYGRSFSIAGQVQKDIGFKLYGIDNYKENHVEPGENIKQKFLEFCEEQEFDFKFINKHSAKAYKDLDKRKKINILHVDGDHSYEGVKTDIDTYTPLVKKGGLLLFHDFGRGSLKGVYEAVSELLSEDGYTLINHVDTLGVIRKK